jgi:hypothetical protein
MRGRARRPFIKPRGGFARWPWSGGSRGLSAVFQCARRRLKGARPLTLSPSSRDLPSMSRHLRRLRQPLIWVVEQPFPGWQLRRLPWPPKFHP